MVIIKHPYKFNGSLKKRLKTTEVILHCSATPEGVDIATSAIHREHLGRGFAGIGYNLIVDINGNIHEGRPLGAVGAHCTNHNSISVGICYVGGLAKNGKTAKDTRTQAQKEALYTAVHDVLQNYGLTINAVHCHREFTNKACPCFSREQFINEYNDFYSKK